MCIGVPMCVLDATEWEARVARVQLDGSRGEERTVSLLLTGPVQPGVVVLVQQDRAERVLDEAEVTPIVQALAALDAIDHGQPFESHFADLINRTPQLPEHLRKPQ